MLSLFHQHGFKKPKIYKGRGCRKCHQSGHRGRLGLYELLEITPEIRAHINRGDHEEEIRKTALEQGFQELLTDGLDKVVRGFVTLEEVLRQGCAATADQLGLVDDSKEAARQLETAKKPGFWQEGSA